ncbi:MAG TPA: hypothetical protein VMD53_11330 [Rhizomicrobium sp.]|nr:hypothetical protein [Rhizomicrobium sp.]
MSLKQEILVAIMGAGLVLVGASASAMPMHPRSVHHHFTRHALRHRIAAHRVADLHHRDAR